MRRQLDRPRFGQAGQSPLGRGVMREPVHAAKAGDRGIIYDHTTSLLNHNRDDPAPHQPRALQVDVEHRVPLLLGQLMRFAVETNARIVEKNVDPAKSRHRLIDRVGDGSVIPHVAREHQRLAALRLHLPFERL